MCIRDRIQLGFHDRSTIVQGGREVWEDPVNVGWINTIETGTGCLPSRKGEINL